MLFRMFAGGYPDPRWIAKTLEIGVFFSEQM